MSKAGGRLRGTFVGWLTIPGPDEELPGVAVVLDRPVIVPDDVSGN